MKIGEVILKSLAIIVLCFLVFYIDSIEFLDSTITKISLIIIALLKSIFFIIQNFKKIRESNQENIVYYKFLIFMGVNITLLIISFAIDFYSLYEVAPESFTGISPNTPLANKLFEFSYYSVLNMTNFGFGAIMPLTLTAKILTALEVILSFIAIIFVLSDFMSLRESIVNRRKN
jgi:uncharacterized membrane protein